MIKDGPLLASIIHSVENQFDYAEAVADELLFIELIPLYGFLLHTPPVYSVLKETILQRTDMITRFVQVEREVADKLRTLKLTFTEMFPDTDDSSYVHDSSPLDMDYMFTFARFDNLLNGKKLGIDTGQPVEAPSPYDNNRPVQNAINILVSKCNKKSEELSNNTPQTLVELQFEISNLNESYNYEFNYLINQQRVSVGESVLFLENVVQEINPKPIEVHSFEELIQTRQNYPFSLAPLVYKSIRDTVYKHAEPNKGWISQIRQHLKRLRHGIIRGLLENQSHQQLIRRFKTRCMWYDKERVRDLVMDMQGHFIRTKEDTLIKEMARYLFDNGYPVMFHVQTENLQSDLMDPSERAAIFIEGKAYTSACKADLLRGVAQLHGYLNNFETNFYRIRDGYFVVFRLDGPIYDFPSEILTNRYRLVPILIDLGDSTVSGSRQSDQPIIVTEAEIINAIDSGKDNFETRKT